MEKTTELLNYLKSNQKRFIAELSRFCTQPSVAAENRGMKAMGQLVEKKLLGLGAKVKKVTVGNSHPFFLAELGQGKKTLLIYDHYDVQPETPLDLWQSPPFKPTLRRGKLFARGVEDNKGNLLLRLQVVEAWQKILGRLPIKIKWLIEGEEEIGSPHLDELAQKYGDFWKDADVCLWETGGVDAEDRPKLTLGLKGLDYVELECQFNQRDLHSGYAAVVASPVWQLINALSSLRDPEGQVTIDGFYRKARKPSAAEMRLVKEQKFDARKLLTTLGAEKSLENPRDKIKFLSRLFFKGTCNLAGIWAGYTVPGASKTVLPNKATAKLDLRLVGGQKRKDILRKLRRHLDRRGFRDVIIRDLTGEEVGKTPVNNKYVRLAAKVLEKAYGQKPYIEPIAYGSGPVFPVASQFKIPIVEIGTNYPGARAHAPNEHIRLKDYEKGMTAMVLFLDSLGRER